jgi:hypothetical protein
VKRGKLKVSTVLEDGTKVQLTLINVNYIPDLWCNLFSVVATMKQGWTLSGKETCLQIYKKDLCLKFKELKAEPRSSQRNKLLGITFRRNIQEASLAASKVTMHAAQLHVSDNRKYQQDGNGEQSTTLVIKDDYDNTKSSREDEIQLQASYDYFLTPRFFQVVVPTCSPDSYQLVQICSLQTPKYTYPMIRVMY